jgi:hypothetical protein
VKNLTQRERNITGIEAGGGHLVEERLELVIVEPVDQGDVDAFFIGQLAGESKACESSSYDDDFHNTFYRKD